MTFLLHELEPVYTDAGHWKNLPVQCGQAVKVKDSISEPSTKWGGLQKGTAFTAPALSFFVSFSKRWGAPASNYVIRLRREEEEELYLRLETRERVQNNKAKLGDLTDMRMSSSYPPARRRRLRQETLASRGTCSPTAWCNATFPARMPGCASPRSLKFAKWHPSSSLVKRSVSILFPSRRRLDYRPPASPPVAPPPFPPNTNTHKRSVSRAPWGRLHVGGETFPTTPSESSGLFPMTPKLKWTSRPALRRGQVSLQLFACAYRVAPRVA
jgi:hypothetical protein